MYPRQWEQNSGQQTSLLSLRMSETCFWILPKNVSSFCFSQDNQSKQNNLGKNLDESSSKNSVDLLHDAHLLALKSLCYRYRSPQSHSRHTFKLVKTRENMRCDLFERCSLTFKKFSDIYENISKYLDVAVDNKPINATVNSRASYLHRLKMFLPQLKKCTIHYVRNVILNGTDGNYFQPIRKCISRIFIKYKTSFQKRVCNTLLSDNRDIAIK